MYNRYTPSADGTFQRTVVAEPPRQAAPEPPLPPREPPKPEPKPCPPPPPPAPIPAPQAPCPPDRPLRKLLPKGIDPGDLLVLAILVLLLMETDEDDSLTLLLTFAAVMLL